MEKSGNSVRPARQAPPLERALVTVLVLTIMAAALWQGFVFLRDSKAPQWVQMILAIAWGVGGVVASFLVANWCVEQLPSRSKTALTPLVFVGPALALLGWFLVMPVVRTLYMSFMDAGSKKFVGLDNYVYAFTNQSMLEAFSNNVLWLAFGTGFSVGFGLLIALLADRTHPRFEAIVESLIFVPYAVSMVGASVIWRFVYAFQPAGASQIGILNAIVTTFGGEPQAWLMLRGMNNLLLIAVLVWLQTGLAMIILSAAVKGIPAELLEAARIDGANEWQVVWDISIPYIQGSIFTVTTMILILTLKVFDIVFTMTGGNYGTEVIANQFYVQMFRSFQYGRGAAIAVVLLVAVVPVMWYNLRQFSERSEAFR
jgi:alpha-glucoside transport system permease protein